MTPQRDRKNGRFVADAGTYVDSKGYPTISAGPLRGMRVHRLVALAKFGREAVENPENAIHHKDSDKLNPHPDNLELLKVAEHNAVSARQYHYLKNNVWPKEKQQWEEYFSEANA